MKVRRLSKFEFLVEGNSLRCSKPNCNFTVSLRKNPHQLTPDQLCPRCNEGLLEPRLHLVDLGPYEANGACGCEHFQMTLEPIIKEMSKEERQYRRLRCVHIHCAREFALDEVILHELSLEEKNKPQPEPKRIIWTTIPAARP